MDWLHSRKLTGVLIIDAFHLEEVTLLRVPVHCHCYRTLKLTCIFPAVPSQSVCCATTQLQLLTMHVKGALMGETHCKTVIMLKWVFFKSQVDTLRTRPPPRPPNPLIEIGQKSGVNQGLQNQLMWP